MRDIVSEIGTFDIGITDLTIIKTTQTSAAVNLSAYNGLLVYVLADQWTDGTMTPVIQVTNDDGAGNPVSANWAAAANADLITWAATSATVRTPVRIGNAQPAAISSAATAIFQRTGYIGGVPGVSDWLRVVSTITGSPATGMGYFVVICRGRPRFMPSIV